MTKSELAYNIIIFIAVMVGASIAVNTDHDFFAFVIILLGLLFAITPDKPDEDSDDFNS